MTVPSPRLVQAGSPLEQVTFGPPDPPHRRPHLLCLPLRSIAVDDGIVVERVPPWTTWPLRQEVLRPGRAVRDCVYPGEDGPRAAHVAALRRGQAPDAALL